MQSVKNGNFMNFYLLLHSDIPNYYGHVPVFPNLQLVKKVVKILMKKTSNPGNTRTLNLDMPYLTYKIPHTIVSTKGPVSKVMLLISKLMPYSITQNEDS